MKVSDGSRDSTTSLGGHCVGISNACNNEFNILSQNPSWNTLVELGRALDWISWYRVCSVCIERLMLRTLQTLEVCEQEA